MESSYVLCAYGPGRFNPCKPRMAPVTSLPDVMGMGMREANCQG